jgi:uncharacterized coiled-coil protein SlyX
MADATVDVAAAPDAGVSTTTHNQMKSENDQLREQLAQLKAKQAVHDDRQRETLTKLQPDIKEFIGDIAKANPEHAELGMMTRWADNLAQSESLDTNMGIARMVSCASANFKRVREEASQLTEKSTLLSDAYKKIEGLESERDTKSTRITELEGLVAERTDAATKLQEELAKHGAITEKFDFSKASSREAGASSSGEAAPAAGASSSRSAAAPSMDDALFAFVSSGGRGGLKIGQSSSAHHLLGASGGEADIANALRFA